MTSSLPLRYDLGYGSPNDARVPVIGAAGRSANVEDRNRMKAQDTDALRTAFLALGPSADADRRFYRIVLDWALALAGTDEGGVLTVSGDGRSMRIEEWCGKGVALKSRILQITDPPESICARAVLARDLQNVPQVRDDPQYYPVSESPIQSLLAVPVVFQGAGIGVVNLESTEIGHFTDAHARTFRQLAEEIAPFWGLVQTAVREFRHRELLDSLRRVSKSHLGDPPDPRRTLDMIFSEALRLTRSDLGGVCLLSLEKDALIVDPAVGLRPNDEKASRVPKGHGFTWRSISTGKSQNIPDVTQHPDVFHDLSSGEIRSMLCAPMFLGREPIGVLNVESTELNHFSLLDEEILSAFANQAALAASTLQLRERFAAADAMAGLGSWSGNLTHRLNNTVGGIRVLSELLSQRLAASFPDLKDISDQINSAAKEALAVVEHYEGISAIEEKQVSVADVVTATLSDIRRPPKIDLQKDLCEPSPIIRVNEHALKEIIRELVRNAVKSLGTVGHIWVTLRHTDYHVLIEVSDDGERIPPEKASHIFRKGYSSRSGASGTGFGLWMITTFMKKCGGEVRLVNHEPSGNTFQLFFPLQNEQHESGEAR
jgi:signal transduction histidine kinase